MPLSEFSERDEFYNKINRYGQLDSRSMKNSIYSLSLGLLSIILSVVAICIAAYRTPELAFDYQGIIVGTLAMLVTVLIGWQIYNIIDIKSTIYKFTKKIKDIDKIKKDTEMQSIYIDAQCSDLSAHSLYIQRRYIEAIEQIIKSLRKYSLIEKKHIVPANIEMCFINFAASLQDECQNNRVSPEKDLYIALLANLRRYPILFNDPERNEAMQWLVELSIQQGDTIGKSLSPEINQQINDYIVAHKDKHAKLKI
jgi:hypothetical protein|nr:MAG TPA: hypothetical protein [Caudoviricetes sp.]